MNKKYRLLKDLPGVYHGVIYTEENGGTGFYNTNGKSYYDRVSKGLIENNPDWFELINERIEVVELKIHDNYTSDLCMYQFRTNLPWDGRKVHKLCGAIEKVLNDDSVFDAEKINAQLDKLKAMEAAFNAARLVRPLPFDHTVYKNFQDYLKELQNKSE